jgi:hypothetical protein
MRMGIDQSRQNDFAGHVHDFSGACRQNIGLNCGDLAVADGDIFQAVDARGRIEDAAAAQKQVECGVHRHARSPLYRHVIRWPTDREVCFVFSYNNIRAIDSTKFMQTIAVCAPVGAI